MRHGGGTRRGGNKAPYKSCQGWREGTGGGGAGREVGGTNRGFDPSRNFATSRCGSVKCQDGGHRLLDARTHRIGSLTAAMVGVPADPRWARTEGGEAVEGRRHRVTHLGLAVQVDPPQARGGKGEGAGDPHQTQKYRFRVYFGHYGFFRM